MKTGAINKNINGWPVIAKWLNINGKRQSDLAAVLNVTASAISQIKNGHILLNENQIYSILDYLKIDRDDMCRLYTLIFNARLNSQSGGKRNSSSKLLVNVTNFNEDRQLVVSEAKDVAADYPDSFCRVPLMTLKQAMNYQPALESIESFARYCSDQTIVFPGAQAGSFALLVDEENATPEFTHSSVLLVAGGEYPNHGDMVVAKLRTGQVITKYYLRHDDVIRFKSVASDEDDFVWHYQEDPGYLQWMYPIIEANVKLRTGSYKFSE
ncbi:MAG: S24 family peptidase [Victivallaceae bacterium]|nr:S24 family peptidase [Victivallaceae bacterium]